MTAMPPPPTVFERFLRHRRRVAIAAWLAFFSANLVANIAIVRMDLAHAGIVVADWQTASWEYTSTLVVVALMPALAWIDRHLPMTWGDLRRSLGLHVLASLVYCLVHVGAMVALRHAVYALHGQAYDFGPWPRGLAYEYLKDARTYLVLMTVIHSYRLLLMRAGGEARLLAGPDDGPALEPVERPSRFLVRKLGREFLVAAADIEYAQAAGNYVDLHVRGHDYPLRSTIGGFESRLDPARFVRVHRGAIINLEHLVHIEPVDSGDARLHMRDGARLPCSRRYLPALRAHAA
jgi:hypothetical protein